VKRLSGGQPVDEIDRNLRDQLLALLSGDVVRSGLLVERLIDPARNRLAETLVARRSPFTAAFAFEKDRLTLL